jgi:outer membrane protein assembly factor BamB
LVTVFLLTSLLATEPLLTFQAPDAGQGVAVDDKFVYVIDNTVVAKHDKFTGELVKRWESDDETPLIHMNSAIVKDGKLYCAHSNYSQLPMTSSVEIWDTETLEHIGSHSFGITDGSLTWMDWHDGFWWGCFAHYDGKGGYPDKNHTWTRVVKFDADWQPLESWSFPEAILERFKPHSCSGGAWGPDGVLYVTGHDRPEVYAVRIPRSGSVLELIDTYPFPNEGQAIAFDKTGTGLLYGLVRSRSTVVASPFPPNR